MENKTKPFAQPVAPKDGNVRYDEQTGKKGIYVEIKQRTVNTDQKTGQ